MIGIYMFENKVNNKKYIGQSRSIETRKKAHYNCSLNISYNGYETKFYRALRKYGYNNFEFSILELCSIEELNDRERYFIEFYDSFKNGYNSSIGGEVVANGYGEDHHQAVLTEKEILIIKEELLSTTKTQYELAEIFHVTQSEISMINNGLRWAYVGDFSYPIRSQGPMRVGEKNSTSILSDEEVLKIRMSYKDKTGKAIYEEYKERLSYTSFERALTGRTYKYLPVYKKKTKEWINPVSTILG